MKLKNRYHQRTDHNVAPIILARVTTPLNSSRFHVTSFCPHKSVNRFSSQDKDLVRVGIRSQLPVLVVPRDCHISDGHDISESIVYRVNICHTVIFSGRGIYMFAKLIKDERQIETRITQVQNLEITSSQSSHCPKRSESFEEHLKVERFTKALLRSLS